MKIIDKIGYIHIKNKKLLVAKSFGKELYYIPGGKRELEETDNETLIRELKEELSIDIIKDTIKFYKTFEAAADGKENMNVKINCYIAEFNGEIKTNQEIESFTFIDSKQKDKLSLIGKIIIEDLYTRGLVL